MQDDIVLRMWSAKGRFASNVTPWSLTACEGSSSFPTRTSKFTQGLYSTTESVTATYKDILLISNFPMTTEVILN